MQAGWQEQPKRQTAPFSAEQGFSLAGCAQISIDLLFAFDNLSAFLGTPALFFTLSPYPFLHTLPHSDLTEAVSAVCGLV
jgi:hypothetical protein